MRKSEVQGKKTYPLDNSAQFYPIMASKKKQSLYRMTAVLSDEVDPDLLKTAANGVIDRFPTFKVRLKKGYAWHYLEENDAEVKVFPDDGVLLRPVTEEETNGYLFRVIYSGKRVSFEVFHGLCDGTGALVFLFALIQKYRLLQGVEFSAEDKLFDLDQAPSESETEDAFRRYYRTIKFGDIDLKNLTGGAPLLLSGTVDKLSCNSYAADYPALSKCAKAEGATFTAFVAGVLAHSVEALEKSRKPIVMMIPVNLRKLFPSDNVRNFVLFVRLVFKSGECKSVSDYVKSASAQLKEKATKENLEKMISTTVRSEKSLLLRLSPLWFKTAIAKFVHVFLKSRQTIIFSNVGNVSAPAGFGLDRVVFTMNASDTSKVNLGVTSVDGKVTFSFMKSIIETSLEEEFCKELLSMGVESVPV